MRQARWGMAAAVLAAGAALAGCQDDKPKLTLSEARTVTDFKTRGEVPASAAKATRGAREIQALLDSESPDPARLAQLTATADRPVPVDATPAQLVAFYFERGNAAADLGRQEQRLADLGQAAELSDRHQVGDRARILQELARAHGRAGRWLDAIATRQQEIDFVENSGRNKGRLFSAYAFMATTAANSGDLAGGQRWLDQVEKLLAASASWRGNPFATYGNSWRASVLDAKASLAAAAGRLTEAEQLAGETLAQLDLSLAAMPSWPKETAPPPGTQEQWRDATVIKRAQIMARQGRLAEAEVEMLPALTSQIKRRGRYSSETADALAAYVSLLLELGRNQDAETLAVLAVDIYEKVGHDRRSLSLARARVQYARALSFQRHDQRAVALYEEVERDLTAVDRAQAERVVRNQAAYAQSLMRLGQADKAVALLRAMVDSRAATLGADHVDTAEFRGLLGVALAAAGDRAGALAAFKTSIPDLIRGTEALGAGGPPVRRVRALTTIIEAYLGLLADLAAEGKSAGQDVVAESFRMADVAHGSSVQQAIAANAARAAVNSPELADLVRRAQDGRQRLAALRALLAEQLAAPREQSSPQAVAALRDEVRLLEAAVASIDSEIDGRFPAFAELMRPKPVTPQQIQAALEPGEALVLTYVGEDRLFAWALSRGRAPAFAATALSRREVNGLVKTLRAGLDPNNDDGPALDLAAAHRLYQSVLAPVAAGWEGARTLAVVPDKALGQLPFSLLVTESPTGNVQDPPGQAPFAGYRNVPWLVRKLAVVQLPSAASLLALRENHAPAAPRAFIGFGDPLFNERQAAEAKAERLASLRSPDGKAIKLARRSLPSLGRSVDTALLTRLPRLPDTADEVRSIAAVLGADPGRDVVLGTDANIRTVKASDLSDRRVVMFATHGLKAHDVPGLAQPALALSSPKVAQVDGNGLLTVDDVLGLKLNADWVVLSACNTAAPEGEGAEAVSGLGRAFFYAGTRAVLVTSWAVETTSAALLTTETFRRVATTPGLSRAEALRQAMLAVMDAPGLKDPASGKIEYTYAHPMFWAPYVLVGDGRG